MNTNEIAIICDPTIKYPKNPPFNPPKNFPEYPFKGHLSYKNDVYKAVRMSFKMLNLDKDNYGTEKWNPLSEVINQNDTVLIKPNFVYHENLSGDNIFAVITHASIIRAIIDYAYKATGDGGKIIIADSPQHNANFDKIIKITGLDVTIKYLKEEFSIPIEVYDLRNELVVYKDGVIVKRIKLPGDPKGYVKVDLKEKSELASLDYRKFYGSDYNRKELIKYHNEKNHIYIVSRSVLESDVIINVPKLKTHKKAGVTLSLKNLLGILSEKRSIIHFRIGSPSEGGDEHPPYNFVYSSLLKINRFYVDVFLSRGLGIKLYKLFLCLVKRRNSYDDCIIPRIIHSGNWYGNDTIWRTILDVYKIAVYADVKGKINSIPQRKMLIMIDGIVGGEGQGPLAPMTKQCGVIVTGGDPVVVDYVTSRLMGFNPLKIKYIKRSMEKIKNKKDKLRIHFKNPYDEEIISLNKLPNLHFKPPKLWEQIVIDRYCSYYRDLI